MVHADQEVWRSLLTYLRRQHPNLCRQWFDEIEPVVISGGVIRLYVPQSIHLRYLQRQCADIFSEAARTTTGRLVTVRFQGHRDGVHEDVDQPNVSPEVKTIAPDPSSIEVNLTPTSSTQTDEKNTRTSHRNAMFQSSWESLYDEMVLNPDYSFENFVVGPNSRLAHAAAIAVAEQPGKAYNPFFIHGGVGLGKTHLLQAICQQILNIDPQSIIYFTSCSAFLNQFMESVKAGEMSLFRNHFRHVDILVVDDIHDLASHDRTQEEFFHTFNSLHQQGRQIVLSSDAAPQEIPHLEARLVSRFKQGLVAPIGVPCYETRIGILKQKASLRSLELPEDVYCHIAQHIDTNIRELEGALNQLQGLAMATERPIDLDLAIEALGGRSPSDSSALSVEQIMSTVCKHFDIKPAELLSKRRHRSIALPRQLAMYLSRHHTSHSLEEIGGYFGGRDHTTVLHADRKITKLNTTDDEFKKTISTIKRQLLIAE